MARPKIEIDPVMVMKLARSGCTNIEISDFYLCSPDTIERRFADEIAKGKASLKMSLRKAQIRSALKDKNVTMMIWLGKQLLGQTDRTQLDITKIPNEIFLQEAQRRLNESEPTGSTPRITEKKSD